MSILQCGDIAQYILSYISPLPRYMRISKSWKGASIAQLEHCKKCLDSIYPEWSGKNGHIALNRAALADKWDLFRIIMHNNTDISCDNAMRICNIFHKDLLMDHIYKLYNERNTHQPIRSWYMWMRHLKGKNPETGAMIRNRKSLHISDMMGYMTNDMITYISSAYNVSINCGRTIFEERDDNTILNNHLHIRFVNKNIHNLFSNIPSIAITKEERKLLHPILYEILCARGLFKEESPIAPTPAPVPVVIVTTVITHVYDGICEALTKKGIRCKKKASNTKNGMHVCYIHS